MEVQPITYAPGIKDFGSVVEQINNFDADAVSMGGYYEPSILLTNALIGRGISPDGYFFQQASDGATSDALGAKKDGVFGYGNYIYRFKTVGNDAFVKEYQAEFDHLPSPHSGSAYAAGQVVKAAVDEAGLDREKIRNFLATETVDTVQGTFEVNEIGQQVGYRFVGVQWQADTLEIVWPEDLATADPIWPKPEWN